MRASLGQGGKVHVGRDVFLTGLIKRVEVTSMQSIAGESPLSAARREKFLAGEAVINHDNEPGAQSSSNRSHPCRGGRTKLDHRPFGATAEGS